MNILDKNVCQIPMITQLFSSNQLLSLGKGWEKLMHGQKIDSSHHDRRRPEHEDTDNTDELDTEEDDEEKCLDMNEYYDNEDEVADCGDCGGGDE